MAWCARRAAACCSAALTLFLATMIPLIPFCSSFATIKRKTSSRPAPALSTLQLSPSRYARRGVKVPLLVDSSEPRSYDVPLPNSHLPADLTTASLYEIKMDIPVHRAVMKEATTSTADDGCCYGHVVHAPGADDLVGAIGCCSMILVGGSKDQNSAVGSEREMDDSGPLYILARGSFRFQVMEIVKSFPYPIALVDELLDDDVDATVAHDMSDEDDIYDTMKPKDLVQEILRAVGEILKVQLEEATKPSTPLERSLVPAELAEQRQMDAEERIAVLQTFVSSLLDIAPDERERLFAVAMMAGELANLPPDVRVQMVTTRNGTQRLRLVLRELASILSLDSARKMTKSLSLGNGSNQVPTDEASFMEAEEAKKELQVGSPSLPVWASQIKKGIGIEYWWDEVEGWCAGTVVEDPVKVIDELIITVKFGEYLRLCVSASSSTLTRIIETIQTMMDLRIGFH